MAPKPRVIPARSDVVVCFDVSETVVAWNAAFEAALREAMSEWVARWGDERTAAAMLDEALLHYKRSRKLGKERLASVRDAVSMIPTDGEERTVQHIARAARRLQPLRAGFVEGAEETLQALSASRYRLAIITNLDEATVRQLWTRLRLHRFLNEKDVFTAAGGVRKPKKRLFRAAAAKLGVPARHCIMVGDSYKQDIKGAVRSGWQAVWIHKKTRRLADRRAVGKQHVYMIPTIRALPGLLQTMKTLQES